MERFDPYQQSVPRSCPNHMCRRASSSGIVRCAWLDAHQCPGLARVGSLASREAPAVLPFTSDEFFGVFAAYNVAIWPVQIAAYVIAAAGAMALWLIFAKHRWPGRVEGALRSFLAMGMGSPSLLFFSKTTTAAYIFGAGSILQGLLFFAYGAIADRPVLRFQSGWRGVLGWRSSSTLRLFMRSLAISPGTAGHVRPCSVLHRVPPSYSPLACSARFLVAIPADLVASVSLPRFCSVFLYHGLVVSCLIGAALLPSRPSRRDFPKSLTMSGGADACASAGHADGHGYAVCQAAMGRVFVPVVLIVSQRLDSRSA